MVKPLRGKEYMMIDEDPFPLAASINIAATDSRAILNTKKIWEIFTKCQGKKGMDS